MGALPLLLLALLFMQSRGSGGGGSRWPSPKKGQPTTPPEPPTHTATSTTTTTSASAALQPLPGSGWKPYQPPPPAVVARAWALLPKLQMGHWVTESDPSGAANDVTYRKEPHAGGKVGVTAYKRPNASMSGEDIHADGEGEATV